MPVPQTAVEKANPNGDKPGAWAQEAGFVSNGAYKLTKWKHNESMTYEKNDNYYDAKNVSIKKLNFMLMILLLMQHINQVTLISLIVYQTMN